MCAFKVRAVQNFHVVLGKKKQAYLLLILTTLFWGGNAVSAILAVGHISPFLLVSGRWLLAFCLALLVAWRYLRQEWVLLRGRLLYVFIMSLLGFSGFNTLFYVAAHSTSALNIGIIQGAIPVLVLTLGAVFLRRSFGINQAIGVLVTMCGVVTVATSGDWSSLLELGIGLGDGLMLTAALLYSVYTLGLSLRPKVNGLSLYLILAASAFVSSLPLTFWEMGSGRVVWPDATGWGLLVYIAIFPSFLSQIFFLRSVDLIGPARAGVFVNLVPVFAPFMAVIFLKEAFLSYHAVSLLLVLGGITIAEMQRGK